MVRPFLSPPSTSRKDMVAEDVDSSTKQTGFLFQSHHKPVTEVTVIVAWWLRVYNFSKATFLKIIFLIYFTFPITIYPFYALFQPHSSAINTLLSLSVSFLIPGKRVQAEAQNHIGAACQTTGDLHLRLLSPPTPEKGLSWSHT